MVAQAKSESGGDAPRGLSSLDAALLRRVAELAAKEEVAEDVKTLAKAMIGIIQMQAEMAELFSQFMQHVSDEQSRRAGSS